MSKGRPRVARGRALRTGIAWDMRSGFKVKGKKLYNDGEKPGIYTVREWRDERHPQRYVNIPAPDGLTYRPGPPPMHAIGARVELNYVLGSDTSEQFVDGDTVQGFSVLRRLPPPRIFANFDGSAFTVPLGFGPDSDLVWGGFELQWGGDNLNWGVA